MPHPHVLINAAMSLDGKLDSTRRQGAALSSPADWERVDQLRAEADAVLVGGRTLLDQDPRLTVKSAARRAERAAAGRPENPAKVGVVSVASLDPGCRFLTAGPARRLIFTTERTPAAQAAILEAAGAEVFVRGAQRVDLPAALETLYALGVHRLMVEGGGTLIAALFEQGLVDELQVYIAPLILGGASAPTLADGPGFAPEQAARLQLTGAAQFDAAGGVLVTYRRAA